MNKENLTIIELANFATDGDIWLEYGWLDANDTSRNMLWYNEGQADELDHWFRSLMTKIRTNEPKGRMYFLAGISTIPRGTPRQDVQFVIGDKNEHTND